MRVVANGVCHSDLWAIANGNWGAPFPMLLGHEGAGIVEEIGEGVTNVVPGDAVLLAWAVPCGRVHRVPPGPSAPMRPLVGTTAAPARRRRARR